MTDLNIVAHMMVRNEGDVIEETVGEILRWVDTLVILDGRSTDGTWELICGLLVEQARQAGKFIDAHQETDPGDCFSNAIRGRLLELTAPHKPDWVVSVDADEIYHYDPNTKANVIEAAIYVAEAQGANVVRCHVPQFWLTFDDLRRGAVGEDESTSVQERRRWYSWGHMGTFIWKWHDMHFYPELPSKRTPELPHMTWREWQRAGPIHPICKHYCFRSLRQSLDRAERRKRRGGRYYFGKYFTNFILDEEEAGLHYLDAEAAWCTENNHDRVYQCL